MASYFSDSSFWRYDLEADNGMSDKEYTEELEKIVIFLCDVYTKGQDSLACQTNKDGTQPDEKWLNVFMSFPTIQGSMNRIYVSRIGNLRTSLLNRESVSMSFEEVFEKLKIGRREKGKE